MRTMALLIIYNKYMVYRIAGGLFLLIVGVGLLINGGASTFSSVPNWFVGLLGGVAGLALLAGF